jgi:hypothetical protein
MDTEVHPLSRSPDDFASFNAWFKALFDNSEGEGIEDNILRRVYYCISNSLAERKTQISQGPQNYEFSFESLSLWSRMRSS